MSRAGDAARVPGRSHRFDTRPVVVELRRDALALLAELDGLATSVNVRAGRRTRLMVLDDLDVALCDLAAAVASP